MATYQNMQRLATAEAAGAMPATEMAKTSAAALASFQALDALVGNRKIVVYDAAVNGASVVINGLSTARRYSGVAVFADNGVTETLQVKPDGATTNCASAYGYAANGIANTNSLNFGTIAAGKATRICSFELSPMRSGLVQFKATIGSAVNDVAGSPIFFCFGATSTNYTSLTFTFSATSRTGWLYLIQEGL